MAKAPQTIRREINDEIMDVFDEEIVLEEDEEAKLATFDFEAISLGIALDDKTEGVVTILEKIAAKNGLSIEIGFADRIRQICLYKKDGFSYSGMRDEDDVAFIKAIGFELTL
ncbi:hypothetical protein IT411_01630 [Candidatus Peregrinibacteria bacterium]|nr:hypothetical protein [Candidatus Peregrinibacteria bacterium]